MYSATENSQFEKRGETLNSRESNHLSWVNDRAPAYSKINGQWPLVRILLH
jgi:hypothetical protein